MNAKIIRSLLLYILLSNRLLATSGQLVCMQLQTKQSAPWDCTS